MVGEWDVSPPLASSKKNGVFAAFLSICDYPQGQSINSVKLLADGRRIGDHPRGSEFVLEIDRALNSPARHTRIAGVEDDDVVAVFGDADDLDQRAGFRSITDDTSIPSYNLVSKSRRSPKSKESPLTPTLGGIARVANCGYGIS